MWYAINQVGCQACGTACDPLALRCHSCKSNPFGAAAYVAGPLSAKQLLTLFGLRLTVALPIILFLWYKESNRFYTPIWREALFMALMTGVGLLFLIQLSQLLSLSRIRLVVEPTGLGIYQRYRNNARLLTIGWDEFCVPEKSSRLSWFKWLGCLLGPSHIIGLILPEALDEIVIKSAYEPSKKMLIPLTESFGSDGMILGWLSVFALPVWLERRWIAQNPESPPSKETEVLTLHLETRALSAFKPEEEETDPKSMDLGQIEETPGESALRRLDLAEEEYFETYVPYGKQKLFVYWR